VDLSVKGSYVYKFLSTSREGHQEGYEIHGKVEKAPQRSACSPWLSLANLKAPLWHRRSLVLAEPPLAREWNLPASSLSAPVSNLRFYTGSWP